MKRMRTHQRQLSFPGEDLSQQIGAAELRQARQLLTRLLSEVVMEKRPKSEVIDERKDPAQPS